MTTNATDRELLEKAARAAGLRLTWGEAYQLGNTLVDCSDIPYALGESPDEAPWYWNPLEDDGDAFRLAVKLRLEIVPLEGGGVDVGRWINDKTNLHVCEFSVDECKATRRAITRAAAAMADATAEG